MTEQAKSVTLKWVGAGVSNLLMKEDTGTVQQDILITCWRQVSRSLVTASKKILLSSLTLAKKKKKKMM